MPVKVARPFNNYGPGLKITDGRVIPDFARNILQGHDIVMHSDGSPRRTFCYVTDAVTGYYKILVKGRPGEAFNVGVETPEISMAELAEKMVDLGASIVGLPGTGRAKGERGCWSTWWTTRIGRCPVITKARTELGFNPRVSIDEGLHRALVWYSGNSQATEA